MSNLADRNLGKLASEQFQRPVSVMNDAQAATLAEYHFGSGRGSNAMSYLTVSTGVGGGFVIGGVPVLAPNGLTGHVGFTTSRLATQRCGCGRSGTIESIAAGGGIASEAYRQGHTVKSAREVFDQSLTGADWAVKIIDRSAAAIAELCANLTASLGIEKVVLGGSIGLADGYADRVRHHLSHEPKLFQPDLVLAHLGQDAVLFGAIAISPQA